MPRFLVMATVTDPFVLAGIQALHGLGFGAWWIGIVALLAQEAPPHLKNSAQTLLMSANYGIGPLGALGLSALLVDGPGTAALYAVAAVLAALASALALYALSDRPGSPALRDCPRINTSHRG